MSFWDGNRWMRDVPADTTTAPPSRRRRFIGAAAEALLITALIFGLIAGTALAAKGGNGGGGGKGGGGKGGSGSCTQAAPTVVVENNYGWSQWGSWGMPGQELTYAVKVINYDAGCGSSNFEVTVSAPNGFTVSPQTSTVSVASSSSAYVWTSVTSPADAAEGTYPVTASVARAGGETPVSQFTSKYMVYSSDETTPTLFWQNPADGSTISGRSYNVTVSSKDDHAVQRVELYMDGAHVATTQCGTITYVCQLHHAWSPSRGQHTATFRSIDWMGNAADLSVSFSVD